LIFVLPRQLQFNPHSQFAIHNYMDSAQQLQNIYLAGFEIETRERFPNAVVVIKGNCAGLLQATPAGLTMIGTPGWKMGELMGVLTELNGRKVFQLKSEVVEATPERLAELHAFRAELESHLAPKA
jgi:hypothetical protein